MNDYGIYRHFKGGYYEILNIATPEDSDEQVIVYKSLQDGKVWTRPVSEFFSEVPEGRENPTGQQMRFESTNFNNQLSTIPSDKLLSELRTRNDCPLELLCPKSDEKLWDVSYLVGTPIYTYITEDSQSKDFDICAVVNTLDEAIQYIKKRENPHLRILKRVFIIQDFD